MRLLAFALVFLWDASAPPPGFSPQKVVLLRTFEPGLGRGLVAAVSPDGRTVATAARMDVRLWSPANGEMLRSFDVGSGVIDLIAFSGDGRHLFVLSAAESVFRVLRLPEGVQVREIKDVDPTAHAIAPSPDGKHVIVAVKGGCRIFEVATGQPVRALAGSLAAYSRDGSRIVTIDEEGAGRIWDARTGVAVATLCVNIPDRCSVALSPDGSRVATATRAGEIRIWDAKDGRERRTFAHPGFSVIVDWSRDGRWVASGGNDGTVRLWNAEEGREVRKLEAHEGMLHSVSFSPDGRSLVTAGADGKAKLWGVPARGPEPLVAAIQVGPAGTGLIGLTGADAPTGGVTITSIYQGSAAERYGLQVGDVITEFNGAAITGYGQLAREVLKYGEGEEATLKVKRGDKEVGLKLRLGRR
jgi:WD40 repeat protein